jgi:hypothetical protein
MRRSTLLALTAALALSSSTAASASTLLLANLTHDQETGVPGMTPTLTSTGAPRPLSFGTAEFILNDAQTEMTMLATIHNIDVTGLQTPDTFDNLVAAHIHVGQPPGMNAPVRWGFFGAPDNDTMPSDLVVTPFASGVGGVFMSVWNLPEGNAGTTLATNLPQILAGLSYLNFHTVQFGGGEIRGQLLVPEPASLSLLALAGLAAARRASRRRSA